MSSTKTSPSVTTLLYLNVPFEEKDTVKKMGAKWDPSGRQWYIPEDSSVSPFHKWLSRQYLDCPYADKDLVKSLGAKWDARAKHWYAPKTWT